MISPVNQEAVMLASVMQEARDSTVQLRRLAPSQKQKQLHPSRLVKAGQSLFYEGDRAQFVYEVKSGVLRLMRLLEDGRRQVIAFAFPGDVVGFPQVGCHTTECDVIASGEVVAYRCDVLFHPDRDPELSTFLMKSALEEIGFLQDHFLTLGRKSATEKTASFLLVLLDRIGTRTAGLATIRLPMNRADIADFLGLTPETVSRAFSHFRALRLIALSDANTVTILDTDGLQAMAEGGSRALQRA
jgi:CRP-like cAMP-binding protein